MDTNYNFSAIESKQKKKWLENPINVEDDKKPGFYCLDMFPYPSGKGLHVGHWRGYVLTDVISRYKILQGYYVLHPMGWDAFGLPAENYAIKQGVHPSVSTNKAIETFKRQLDDISAVYDWSKEINTTDPNYYKWTQWIFVKMFEKGLAYEKEMPLNWCPSCKTVLANEEAVGGECDRCHSTVTKKMLRQWMLRITEYADRLLNDLDRLDWAEKVKKMQADWIGKSYGAEVDFVTVGGNKPIRVYTTRPDTLFGATFMVLSPEHRLVKEITSLEQAKAVDDYVFAASTKSSVDRLAAKEKSGVFTGCYAINPLTEKQVPVWVSDYVLADYGTGAIMCVPAHDSRDFEFAKKFGLPIVPVRKKSGAKSCEELNEAFEEEGTVINSPGFDGMNSSELKDKMPDVLEEKGIGKKTVNYKLRDWVFSRQRYWGEPIPIIHCEHCGAVGVPDKDLPVRLPDVESYLPTDTGESPLAAITDWVNTTCPKCNAPAKRETNTMPQWAGSSWYFLRYPDVNNDSELIGKKALEKWLPVDYYAGGIEHAVLHLLYARFYTKFLYDIGVVNFEEPFSKLFNQGMITKDGFKMDKSRGNGVSPDDMIEKYGRDALRMYILFIGPPEQDSEWESRGLEGVFRYLTRVWKLVSEAKGKIIKTNSDLERARHKMIYDITTRLDNLSLNTVVSGFMEHTNKLFDLMKQYGGLDADTLKTLAILLAPFTPHIAEEIWESLGGKKSVFCEKWPEYDIEKTKEDTLTIVVQINGKVRENILVPAGTEKEEIISLAKASVTARLEGADIMKEIYVPNKLVNIVIKM